MDRISASSAIRPVNYANAQPPSDRESESVSRPLDTYVQAWHVPPFGYQTRHDGSYERLSAHLLGAILWLDRTAPMTEEKKEWATKELQQYLERVYIREDLQEETAQELAKELVRNCGQGAGHDEPSAATIDFARDALREIREQNKIKVDVDDVLHGMANDHTLQGFAAMKKEAVSDQLYQNHLMAWVKLGPGDEANARAKVARKLLQMSLSGIAIQLVASDLGLTSLPDLPEGLELLNVGNNKLTELPVFPDNMRVVLVHNNAIERLPWKVPKCIDYCYVENNRLTEIPYQVWEMDSRSKFCCAGNKLSEETVDRWKNLISNKGPNFYNGAEIIFKSEPPDLRSWDDWYF